MDLKNKWKMLIWICAAAGWWGVFFPDFTLTEDTYKIVYDESFNLSDEERELVINATEFEELLMNAKPGQIRIKSKLYTIISKRFEEK